MTVHFTIMQSQFWLAMAQQACRAAGVSFDLIERRALLDVVPPGDMAVSLTLAQIDRLLLLVDEHFTRQGSSLFAFVMNIDFSRSHGLCSLLSAKPTLGAACQYLESRLRTAHPGYHGRVEHLPHDRVLLTFELRGMTARARQCHEQVLFAMFCKLRQQFFSDNEVRLHRVIVSPELLARSPWLLTHGVVLEVSEQRSGLEFDSQILMQRLPWHSPGLERTLQQVYEAVLINDRIMPSHANQVLDLLLARIGDNLPYGLADIAGALHIKPRTLQHYLGQERVSFNYLRSHALAHIACGMIAEGSTIDEIVLHLGYSSRSAFHHAFTRSTGLRPTQVRRGQLPQRAGVTLASPPSTL